MRARTAPLITTAAALFVGAFENPAHAKQATWKQLQHWKIVGDADVPYCGGFSMFKDGTVIHMSLNPGGWNFAIQGVAATPGAAYNVTVATTDTTGVLQGEGLSGGNGVLFKGMAPSSIAHLAVTPKLYIQGLGTFNMKGSYKAVLEILDCYKAISGVGI